MAEVRLSSGGCTAQGLCVLAGDACAISGTPVGHSLTSRNNGETKQQRKSFGLCCPLRGVSAYVCSVMYRKPCCNKQCEASSPVARAAVRFDLSSPDSWACFTPLPLSRATPSLSSLNPRPPSSCRDSMLSDQYSPDSGDRDSAFVRLPMRNP